MRFNFRELPETGTTGARAWPIVDVGVEGLDIAPQACLLDSGATAVRFGAYLADLCGIDLSGAPEAWLAVGGGIVNALMAEVHLLVKDRLHGGDDLLDSPGDHLWIFGARKCSCRAWSGRGENHIVAFARLLSWPSRGSLLKRDRASCDTCRTPSRGWPQRSRHVTDVWSSLR